jgi:6-phosphogluconolactonase
MRTVLVLCGCLALVACGDSDPAQGGGGNGNTGGDGAGTSSDMGGAGAGPGAGGSGGEGIGGFSGMPSTPYVYVGTGAGVIEIYLLDRATGALSSLGEVPAGNNPSFLAGSPGSQYLYAVDESSSEVLAFAIEGRGMLTEIGERQSSEGNGPAYVSVDPTGQWVLVSNYGGGTVAVLPVLDDGSLGQAVDVESPGQNPHLIRADASGTHVYVPCLGDDIVAQFDFDAATGQLTPMANDAVLPNGTEPRHLEFHPTQPKVYVIGEESDTLTTFSVDGSGGLVDPVSISTLPNGANAGENFCADLHIHPNGELLYGSNRGNDSIAHFALDDGGNASADGHTPTDGDWPRNFGIDVDGGIMLVANQQSDEIVTFAIDEATGALSQRTTTPTSSSPAWVGVIPQWVALD